MKFERIFLILVTVIAGIGTHQYINFSKQVRVLNHHLHMSKNNVSRIEATLQEEDSLLKQLDEAESRYEALRTRLPAELSEGDFSKRLTEMTDEHNIKVLAKTQAVYGRPSYREAVIATTLETSDDKVQKLLDELLAAPRIVNVVEKNRTDKDHLEISIAIYATDVVTQPVEKLPDCIDEPTGVWLPLWKPQLAERYKEYESTCTFVQEFGSILAKRARLSFLHDENGRLQGIIDQLLADKASAN